MIFETRLTELSRRYFADVRTPDVAAFVEGLFHVAAETGALACTALDAKRLRFFVPQTESRSMGLAPRATQALPACLVEHETAIPILRMICARLGAICQERTTEDISPYGAKTLLKYDVQDYTLWSVSFTNTPARQEFLIEATE